MTGTLTGHTTRAGRTFSPFVLPSVAPGVSGSQVEVSTDLDIGPLLQESIEEADHRADDEEAGESDFEAAPATEPPSAGVPYPKDELQPPGGFCAYSPSAAPPAADFEAELLPASAPLSEALPRPPSGFGAHPLSASPPSTAQRQDPRIARMPPLRNVEKSPESKRRAEASQKRKKAKRSEKALARTSSFGYRTKASALPLLEGLAAEAARLDVARASVSSSGAYVGRRAGRGEEPQPKEVPTLGELLRQGFEYHRWDGIHPEVFTDSHKRVFAILAGRPACQDPLEWQRVADGAAAAMAIFRDTGTQAKLFRAEDHSHRRGRYLAIAAGVSFGGGQKVPGNLVHSRPLRLALQALLDSKEIQRIAGFQSSALALFAPKLYRWLGDRLARLFAHHQSLRQNFRNSIYTSITLNCGPGTECVEHLDHANAANSLCAITALGSFNPKTSGHLVLFTLRRVIEFPPGSTILIPSAFVAHGNTRIQPGETRLSATQYVAGGLIRWVDYGFRSAKSLLLSKDGSEKRLDIDGPEGSRWKRVIGLFSKVAELAQDRRHALN